MPLHLALSCMGMGMANTDALCLFIAIIYCLLLFLLQFSRMRGAVRARELVLGHDIWLDEGEAAVRGRGRCGYVVEGRMLLRPGSIIAPQASPAGLNSSLPAATSGLTTSAGASDGAPTAEAQMTQARVAVKLLHPALFASLQAAMAGGGGGGGRASSDSDSRAADAKELMTELAVLARINHPNILRLLGGCLIQ